MNVKEFSDYDKACEFREKVGGQVEWSSYKGNPLWYVWYPKEEKHTVDEMESRIKLANNVLNETIKCQKNKMEIAERYNNNQEYLKAYDMKSMCEQIKDILDDNFDVSE